METAADVSIQTEPKKGEQGGTNAPDFSSAPKILLYLSGRTEAFIDASEPGTWGRRLSRIAVCSTLLVILLGSCFLVLGLRQDPFAKSLILTLGGVAYVFWACRFLVWIRQAWQARKVPRRPTLVRIVERDESHALPLTACSESLLIYVRQLLKNHADTISGRMNSLLKGRGLFSLLTLVAPVWHWWGAVQTYLANHSFGGFTSFVGKYGYICAVVLIAWFLLLRFFVWWSVSDYTYQIELVDLAIRMKRVLKAHEPKRMRRKEKANG